MDSRAGSLGVRLRTAFCSGLERAAYTRTEMRLWLRWHPPLQSPTSVCAQTLQQRLRQTGSRAALGTGRVAHRTTVETVHHPAAAATNLGVRRGGRESFAQLLDAMAQLPDPFAQRLADGFANRLAAPASFPAPTSFRALASFTAFHSFAAFALLCLHAWRWLLPFASGPFLCGQYRRQSQHDNRPSHPLHGRLRS